MGRVVDGNAPSWRPLAHSGAFSPVSEWTRRGKKRVALTLMGATVLTTVMTHDRRGVRMNPLTSPS
jgi:hypothetical protein